MATYADTSHANNKTTSAQEVPKSFNNSKLVSSNDQT